MDPLYRRLGAAVKGVLSGFDRIVFKGLIRPLMHTNGVESFLRSRGVLNKDFSSWMQQQTATIIGDAEALSRKEDRGRIRLFGKERKDEVVTKQRERLSMDSGLIGVWSALESCNTFKAVFSSERTYPELRFSPTKCKHLYTYLDHEKYGLMHIRLQTWFPFGIQIAMNGRQWLARSLAKQNIGFDRHRNKFLHIDNLQAAQLLLQAQLDVDWPRLLNDFLPMAFPAMSNILGPHLSYYWTLWQSEWATDYLFQSSEKLAPLTDDLLKHAWMTGTSERVLRYMDRPFTMAGDPYQNNNNEVNSRRRDFQDGARVRHWVDGNSVKAYTEQNNLRVETTINQPGAFKVHRCKEGAGPNDAKDYLPLRKGVADIPLRAAVSQQVNSRMAEHLATCASTEILEKTLAPICKTVQKQGRRWRALQPLGTDRQLLLAITDPTFNLGGLTNRGLREKLAPALNGYAPKQATAKVSRLLRMLRDHGLIAKIPNRRRYRITPKGIMISTSVVALLKASTQELMKFAG